MNETQNPQETEANQPINQSQENQQQSPPLNSPIKESKKTKNITAIILSMLLVVALGVGGYFAYMYYQKPQTNNPVNTPETQKEDLPTSGATYYENTVHNISFEHPSSWVLEEKWSEYKCGLNQEITCNTQIILSKDEAVIHLYLAMDGIGGVGQSYEGVPVVIDGHKLFQYEKSLTSDMKYLGITDSLTKSLGVFMVNDITYSISISYPSDYSSMKEEEVRQVFNQILSTFKFNKSTSLQSGNKNGNIFNFYKIHISYKPGQNYANEYNFLAEYLNQLFEFPNIENPNEEFTRFATDTSSSNTETERAIYMVLKSQKISTPGEYSDQYANVTVESADPALYPFFIDSEYCEEDLDCTIRSNFCSYGAYNKFMQYIDVWGCGPSVDYGSGWPEWGSYSEDLQCYIEVEFENARCQNNKCVETDANEVCLEDQNIPWL
ncbi:hypothetical protein ACFL1M_03180 [Patescibacteria group bacterium]